jgi:glucose/arabinose dehydrogenase
MGCLASVLAGRQHVPMRKLTSRVHVRRRVLALASVAALTGTTASMAHAQTADVAAPPPLSAIRLSARAVHSGLNQPIDLASGPDGLLLVAERAGTVRDLSAPGRPVALSIRGVSTRGERGLLGIAVSNDGGELYTAHTDRTGDLLITAYPLTRSDRVVAGAGRVLMRIEHRRYSNHNGGSLDVDANGLLYIATGDGGGSGGPLGRAERLNSFSGKILRIDPRPSGRAAYTVPPTNPFVGSFFSLPEIYAFGLRNPWRISIDRTTDQLWIGDVGQNRREEINVEVVGATGARGGGQNYGWPTKEASLPFRGTIPANVVDPVHEYDQGGRLGCSVTGGVVMRASSGANAAVDGAYVYGDFCSGRLALVRQDGGRLTDVNADVGTVTNVVAFEQTATQTLAVSLSTGTVFELVVTG